MRKIPTGWKTRGLILFAIVATPFVQGPCDRAIRRWETTVPPPDPDRVDYLNIEATDR